MTANTQPPYYYILITVYPLKGNPYPRPFVTDTHPIDAYLEYSKKAMALTTDLRPYRVTLSFFAEIPKEQYDNFIEETTSSE